MGLLDSAGPQVKHVWTSISVGHRILLVLLVLLSIAAVAGVISWGGEPHYQLLATNMPAKEAAALCGALRDAGIPVRMNTEGDAVLVAGARLADARMIAAEKGLPHSASDGFEVFAKPKFGMTSDAQKIMYVGALQNELARTIISMDCVADARVHLVIPERRLFPGDQARPTASVLIVAGQGHRISTSNAGAIANIVAGAVEGLAAEDVTITDDKGSVISGTVGGAAEAVAADRFALRQKHEAYLTAQAESMLTEVLGYGKCKVRVCADLEFTDLRTVEEKIDPARVKTKELIETSSSEGGGMATGGVTGSAAEMPSEPEGESRAAVSAPAMPKSVSEKIESEWKVSGSKTERLDRGASVKKLTVAAFVDLSGPETAAEEGAETPATAAATPTLTVEDVTAIIKDAVGFDEARGDSLNVVETTFHQMEAGVGPVGGISLLDRYGWLGKWVAVSVLGLVMLVIARRALRGIVTVAPRRVMVPEVLGGETGANLPGGVAADEVLRREVSKFVEGSPEMAGRLLEGWIEGEAS